MKISSWANKLNPKVADAHGDGSPSASQAPCTIVKKIFLPGEPAGTPTSPPPWLPQVARRCPHRPLCTCHCQALSPCTQKCPHTGRRAGSCLQPASALIICLWHPNTPNYFSMQTVAVHLLRHQAGACRKYSNAGHVLISSENGTFYVC